MNDLKPSKQQDECVLPHRKPRLRRVTLAPR
jgi:hypothetical protein